MKWVPKDTPKILTESEKKIVDEENEIKGLMKKHPNNEALQQAYEQIQSIRILMGYQENSYSKVKEDWVKRYMKLQDEIEFDESNPTVQQAWDQYYVIKTLFDSGDNEEDTE